MKKAKRNTARIAHKRLARRLRKASSNSAPGSAAYAWWFTLKPMNRVPTRRDDPSRYQWNTVENTKWYLRWKYNLRNALSPNPNVGTVGHIDRNAA